MECALIILVYVVVFLGIFIFVVVPWLWANIFLPLLLLLDELLALCWEGAKKLVEGIGIGVASTVLVVSGGMQSLWRQIIWPVLLLLADVLKALWAEFYFWTVGDGEQD